MATPLDVSALATANRLLDKFGISAILTAKPTNGFDPLTGEVSSSSTPITIPKVSPPLAYASSEIDGSNIIVGDYKVIVARSDSVSSIDRGDRIEVNGRDGVVVNTNEVWSGEEIAIWILQCRTGG